MSKQSQSEKIISKFQKNRKEPLRTQTTYEKDRKD